MDTLLLRPLPTWADYELIDSGNFKKLERFGAYILDRPEPQALWSPALSDAEWRRLAHAAFDRKGTNTDEGSWQQRPEMPDQWWMSYKMGKTDLQFRLGLTAFKHVGIFPEQADNWHYSQAAIAKLPPNAKVLNLFAYTGGASLAAAAAGADVTHLDAVKPVVSWARQNMEQSQLKDIRWVVEDALKFAQREAKRGRTYQGIILDPPAYGRGPDGEKWVMERNIAELMAACAQIVDPAGHFIILNLYSLGYSSLLADNLLAQYFGRFATQREAGELYIADRANRRLPLGVFGRYTFLK